MKETLTMFCKKKNKKQGRKNQGEGYSGGHMAIDGYAGGLVKIKM